MDRFWFYFGPDEADTFAVFWTKQFLISAGIIAGFYLLSKVVRLLLCRAAGAICARTTTDLDDRILERVQGPIALLINSYGLYVAIKRLPTPEKVNVIAAGALFVVNIAIITVIAYRIMKEMLERYGRRMAGEELSRQVMPLVEKLATIFLVTAALIVTLKHFNYDILTLITALGVGSLAIGLAAKDTLAHMISGFTLMVDRPFRIGDRIQLGTQVGDVMDIGLRSTKIKALDNTVFIIPNSDLCNSTLINMAFPDVKGKGRINIGVAYGSDVEKVKALLVEIAASVPTVLKDPAPEAYFVSFGDSALNLSLFFWVADYTQTFGAQDQINCAIHTKFQEYGITIPFPIRTVIHEKDSIHAPQD